MPTVREVGYPYPLTTVLCSTPAPFSRTTGHQKLMNDPVNHPNHYTGFSNGTEVIDITENLSFNIGNAVKYCARAGRVDGRIKGDQLEDLKKAHWYIDREINRLNQEQNA